MSANKGFDHIATVPNDDRLPVKVEQEQEQWR